MSGLRVTFAIALIGVLASSAIGEDAPTRYQVEMIAFRHVDQTRNTPETASPPARRFSDRDDSAPTADDERRSAAPSPKGQSFYPLDDSKFELIDMMRRLRELDAYAPLAHTGWIQEARSTTEALPHRISMTTRDRRRLTGTITLYKQRYLHLNVDLELDTSTLQGLAPSSPDRSASGARLVESRRVKGETINYFDHPQLGLLVTVRELSDETEPANSG